MALHPATLHQLTRRLTTKSTTIMWIKVRFQGRRLLRRSIAPQVMEVMVRLPSPHPHTVMATAAIRMRKFASWEFMEVMLVLRIRVLPFSVLSLRSINLTNQDTAIMSSPQATDTVITHHLTLQHTQVMSRATTRKTSSKSSIFN